MCETDWELGCLESTENLLTEHDKGVKNLRAGEDEIVDPLCDPSKPIQIPFHEVTSAAFLIKGGVVYTPCPYSQLSEQVGMELYLKKEFMQHTGSFKERGARYALLMLSDEQKKRGVIAASSGNHAQGVCYHALLLGIPATVVMPTTAAIMKIEKCRKMKARVVLHGADIGDAKVQAMKISKSEGLAYINGYDHPHILAGQGTIGLEILEQVQEPDAIVVPVGGAGLIAGIAVAIKGLRPATKVIGVESEMNASLSSSLAKGKPFYTPCLSTLADGLSVPLVGYNAFATIQPLLYKMIVVKEEWIALGMLKVVELEKNVIEGAAACCLAAAFSGQLDEFKGKKVVLVLSGGNIDSTIFGRCIERGLASEGRLVRFNVRISDRPGGIAELCQLLGSLGISIKDITQERAWLTDIYTVQVKVICETRNWDHTVELRAKLMEKYSCINFTDVPLALSAEKQSMLLKCE